MLDAGMADESDILECPWQCLWVSHKSGQTERESEHKGQNKNFNFNDSFSFL